MPKPPSKVFARTRRRKSEGRRERMVEMSRMSWMLHHGSRRSYPANSLLRRRAEPQQARARAFADHRHVTCDAVVADHVRVRITGLPFCQRGELGLRTVLFRELGDQHIGARLL